MRRAALVFCLMALGCAAMPALAASLDLPGIASDARLFQRRLTASFPAGGTPQARIAADQRASAAIGRGDWTAAVPALEARIGLGEPSADLWHQLATALMRRTPPDPRTALLAAWQEYAATREGPQQVGALLLMADVLHGMDRPAQEITVLAALAALVPANAAYQQRLAAAEQSAGLLVRRVRTEGEADPPRACIGFYTPLTRRGDFVAQDWVSLAPAVPDAAVTREAGQLCISGLPSGATTRVTLRAGLPGDGDIALHKATTLAVAMPNRAPRILFDTRLFVLPRGQAAAATMTTTNLSAVKLTLIRLSERSIAAVLRNNRLTQPMEAWTANNLADQHGSVVWQGSAAIPVWTANQPAHTALPFPPALTTAGPGLYALVATPGDGTNADSTSAVQIILRTDLAPTVWRGSDGLTVQLRSYADALPRAAVRLDLLARNNDILGTATTDADGVAHFPVSLLHGDGPLSPLAVQAFAQDGDFATIDLTAAAFDLADRGVAGRPDPGPLDAFVWLDRGIYRPGETVQVMALLRDAAGNPADIPTELRVLRPNGQVFLKTVPPRGPDSAIHLPVTLSAGAAAGMWSIELRADPAAPPIGQASFRVDAFVPDRLAVDLGPNPPAIVPGQATSLPVAVRYLYGAPGAGLSGKASLHLAIDRQPFPRLAAYHFGLQGEAFAPDAIDLALPDTDAQGHSRLAVTLARAPDTTQALQAEIDVAVNDPSGHAVRAATTMPVRGANPFIGIRPAFAGGAVDAGTEAAFDILAVHPDGTPMAMAAKLRLVRERPDWHVVMDGRLARYETVWRDEPLETRDIAIPADGVLHFARKLEFGRYRLEIAQTGGMAITSYRFRSGWAGADSPDVPDRVDVSADRQLVPVGQNVTIHIAPPFAGQATVLVLTDRVISRRNLAVPAGGADLQVPVEASWGPGAYVAVHVFRGESDAAKPGHPARAIGLVWVGVDPGARKLAMGIDVPDHVLPRAAARIAVRTAPGAWVSLAAVDEGILRLTHFVSPDPTAHFLGRRRLGIDIRDDWGRLIAAAQGGSTLLRQGGDEGAFSLPEIPQQTVTLFSPPVQAGPDGQALITLPLPDFNGQVRLMAVSWLGTRIGAANTDLVVRDRLIAEPLLPRFLAPGDATRLAVLLHDLDLPKGEMAASITLGGPLALEGPNRLAATLAPGGQALETTTLRATGAGRGTIALDVTGPDGFHITRHTAILVRSSRAPLALLSGGALAPGAQVPLVPAADRFLPGTWRATATFGAPLRYDAGALVQALADYPLSCLEQATSRGLPLAMLPDGAVAGPQRAARLAAAVASVLDRQRFDGGFALWTANGEAEPWLSAYATDFLLRARDAGAPVPAQALTDAVKFLTDAASDPGDKPADRAAQAYRLYVLARAGHGLPGAARVLAEHIADMPTPLAKAQLGAALALAHDRPRAEAAFAAALAAPARGWWPADYGTALRDQAAIAVLLKESGLLADRLAHLVAALPGADLAPDGLNTQEQAWAAAAAAALGRAGAPVRVAVDGHALAAAPLLSLALAGPATAHNLGTQPVWQSVAITGVPREAPPAARRLMRVSRQFETLDGAPLALDALHQNTVFVLVLDAHAEDGQAHRAMLMQGLPAGWEIASRMAAGPVPGMAWLGKLSQTEAEPAADDRFAAVATVPANGAGIHLAVRLRAVTPGDYALPGASVADMYRPALYARQAEGRVTVLPP
ncbi:MAG: alpha-2-macroglobulin family protein [Rhodospirillales bacterium]|nr:alpha-2-macroglobulin family protein [Rhodospirillales bacterium]